MRLLLDTHALLWWLDGDRRLSRRARQIIGNDENTVLVSAASAWEIATKARLGKLPGALDVAADIAGCLARQRFDSLDITVLHPAGRPAPGRTPRSVRPNAHRPGADRRSSGGHQRPRI